MAQLIAREDFERVAFLHFCVSDTEEGRLLGAILGSYYKESAPRVRLEIHEIDELSGNNPERFKTYGLRNLARSIGNVMRQ